MCSLTSRVHVVVCALAAGVLAAQRGAPAAELSGDDSTAAQGRALRDVNPAYGFSKVLVTVATVRGGAAVVVSGVSSVTSEVLWETVVSLSQPLSERPTLLLSRPRPFSTHAPEVALVFKAVSPAKVRVHCCAGW